MPRSTLGLSRSVEHCTRNMVVGASSSEELAGGHRWLLCCPRCSPYSDVQRGCPDHARPLASYQSITMAAHSVPNAFVLEDRARAMHHPHRVRDTTLLGYAPSTSKQGSFPRLQALALSVVGIRAPMTISYGSADDPLLQGEPYLRSRGHGSMCIAQAVAGVSQGQPGSA